MQKPKEFHRYTLNVAFDEHTVQPVSGIYILAYMGTIIYVGQSADIPYRLLHHCSRGRQRIDAWLRNMAWDYGNVRLDILETPHGCNEKSWLNNTENACIKQVSPLLNVQLNH